MTRNQKNQKGSPKQACTCKDESGKPKQLFKSRKAAEAESAKIQDELSRKQAEWLRRMARPLLPQSLSVFRISEVYKCPAGKGYHITGAALEQENPVCECRDERGELEPLFLTQREAESEAENLEGELGLKMAVAACVEGKGFHLRRAGTGTMAGEAAQTQSLSELVKEETKRFSNPSKPMKVLWLQAKCGCKEHGWPPELFPSKSDAEREARFMAECAFYDPARSEEERRASSQAWLQENTPRVYECKEGKGFHIEGRIAMVAPGERPKCSCEWKLGQGKRLFCTEAEAHLGAERIRRWHDITCAVHLCPEGKGFHLRSEEEAR